MKRNNYILLILGLSFFGCYYDKVEVLYPGSTHCTEITTSFFSVNVLPLLNSRCNSCHGGSSPSGGIALDTYDNVLTYVNKGSLMGSINFQSGYSPMPKNSGKMSACEIRKIQSWIDAGALNN
ncbi:MAG: hypothetical protein JNM78_11370 [Cyclobacteriaceae bacterium]|nr:hypothetical protein [Cyclobacteriaceae bacterium]